jgi:hypothetical protein
VLCYLKWRHVHGQLIDVVDVIPMDWLAPKTRTRVSLMGKQYGKSFCRMFSLKKEKSSGVRWTFWFDVHFGSGQGQMEHAGTVLDRSRAASSWIASHSFFFSVSSALLVLMRVGRPVVLVRGDGLRMIVGCIALCLSAGIYREQESWGVRHLWIHMTTYNT